MIIDVENFNLKDTITSGACFRVIEENDGSFTNILSDRVINIKQEKNKLIVKSSKQENLKEIIINYFDLDRDYESINNKLSDNDEIMKRIVEDCDGYKIMNQDPFEMCISYIISQNNNVKRIGKSIELLSNKYGTEIEFNNKKYYLFPKYNQIKNITTEELRNFGLGFRDKYVRNFLDKYINLNNIENLNTEDAIKELTKVKGIGLKVASCILLFGYKRLDVFPIDTWVKKFVMENYGIKNDQKNIEKFAKNKYGEYSGLAIQYMFNSKRNK